jgi:hypothetical protein
MRLIDSLFERLSGSGTAAATGPAALDRHQRTYRYSGQGFDAGELTFLEMLSSLEPGKTSALSVLQDAAAEAVAENKASDKTADAAKEKEAVEKTPSNPTALVEQMFNIRLPGSDQPHTLSKYDISEDDLQFLKTALQVPNGVPMHLAPYHMALSPVDAAALADSLAEDAGGGSSSVAAISEKLNKLLQQAQKSSRPIRIDIDNHAAIILRICQGRVSAEFRGTGPGMSPLSIQQQLQELQSRLEAQNLPVGRLTYRGDEERRNPYQQESRQQQPESSAQQQENEETHHRTA